MSVGDLSQDDMRADREWPGIPGAMRDHEGGGEISTARFQIGRPEDHMLSREPALEPLEGPEHDVWLRGWRAGALDSMHDAIARDRADRRRAALTRLDLLIELGIVLAVIAVAVCTILAIAHT